MIGVVTHVINRLAVAPVENLPVRGGSYKIFWSCGKTWTKVRLTHQSVLYYVRPLSRGGPFVSKTIMECYFPK